MGFPELVVRVRELSPAGFWFVLAALVTGVSAAFYFIWRSLHRARIVEDMPTARVRSAYQGYVELEGRGLLLDGPPIVGPLTGTRCLWYRYKIEHHETRGDGRGSHWGTLQAGVSDGLFALDDGTGRCLIDPEGAEVIPGEKDVWYGNAGFPRRGPPASKSWFRLGSGEYRYTEERLMPGDLYALGWFHTVDAAAGDLRADVVALLRDWKGDQPALRRRFDRDGDGRIDAEEWDAARAAAQAEALARRRDQPRAPTLHVLARAPSDRHPFLLSALSQRVLATRYRRRALAALVAFLIGTAVTLGYVVARVGG